MRRASQLGRTTDRVMACSRKSQLNDHLGVKVRRADVVAECPPPRLTLIPSLHARWQRCACDASTAAEGPPTRSESAWRSHALLGFSTWARTPWRAPLSEAEKPRYLWTARGCDRPMNRGSAVSAPSLAA